MIEARQLTKRYGDKTAVDRAPQPSDNTATACRESAIP